MGTLTLFSQVGALGLYLFGLNLILILVGNSPRLLDLVFSIGVLTLLFTVSHPSFVHFLKLRRFVPRLVARGLLSHLCRET